MREADITGDPVVILRKSADRTPEGVGSGVLSVMLRGREYIIHPEQPIDEEVPTALGRLPDQIDTGQRIAMELEMPFVVIEASEQNLLD